MKQVTIDDVERVLKDFAETNPDASYLISVDDGKENGFSMLEGFRGNLVNTLVKMLWVDEKEYLISTLHEATQRYMFEKKQQADLERISVNFKSNLPS